LEEEILEKQRIIEENTELKEFDNKNKDLLKKYFFLMRREKKAISEKD